MYKLSEIKDLVKLVDESSIDELEIEKEGARIRIARNQSLAAAVTHMSNVLPAAQPAAVLQQPVANEAGQAPVQQEQQVNSSLHTIASPMVGTFYVAPAPDAPPFVKKGDKVAPDTIVCIVEAMKLMNEIEAEVKGEIVDVLVEDGQLVEFGQPLFLVKQD